MSKFYLKIFLLLIFNSCVFASANTDNKNETPLSIEADSFNYNNQTGIATYRGAVIAIQGDRKLQAEQLIIKKNSNGDINEMQANGNPAKINFNPENGETIYGEGLQIEFYQNDNLLILIDNAKLEQQQDVYQAPRIEYNILNKTIRSPENKEGRTKIIFHPKNKS